MPTPQARPNRLVRAAALAACALAALASLPAARGAAVPGGRGEREIARRALSETLDGPYAHVATWPLASLPGPASQRFVVNDLAQMPDGRLLVADWESRTVLAIDPADGSTEFWPHDLPEQRAEQTTPTAVVALHRSPGAIVVWSLEAANGTVSNVVEERDAAGGIVRRLPFEAVEVVEDRLSGDVLFWQVGGTVERRAWPSLEVKSVFNAQGEPIVGGLAMAGDRIAVMRDSVVRVLEAATGRPRVFLAPADGGQPIQIAADGAGFWMLSHAQLPRIGIDLTRFDGLGARTATWSEADLSLFPNSWLATPGLDVATAADGRPTIVFAVADSRLRVHVQRGCPMVAGPCDPPLVISAATMFRGRPQERSSPGDLTPHIAGWTAGGVLVFLSQSGQLVALDAGGRPQLLAAIDDDVLEVAADGAGGVVMVVRPMTATLGTATAGADVIRFRPEDLVGGRPSPAWRVPCDCPFGPQLAGDGLQVFLARPTAKRISLFSVATGEPQGELIVPTDSGLWPSDVAVTADGTLWTADAPNAEVQGWPSDANRPTVRWPAGFLASPWRLAAGAQADGTSLVAVQLADGIVELHHVDGNTVALFDPQAGGSFEAGGLAVGSSGRIAIVDEDAAALRIFARVPPPAESPTPAPTPTPRRATCLLNGDKTAGPPVVVLGNTADVTLTLAADCPPQTRAYGADVVLVIDRSGSMNFGKLDAAVAAATEFTSFLDMRLNRIGLISFNQTASVIVPLTANAGDVVSGLQSVLATGQSGGTDIGAAMTEADSLLRAGARVEALPVVVFLTDGRSDRDAALAASRAARNRGVRIYTIGLGDDADHDVLAAMAAGRYFPAPTTAELFPIYREVLRLVSTSLSGNVMIDDRVGPDVRYEIGSSLPPAILNGDVNGGEQLSWGRSILSPAGITLTYRVRPLKVGRLPTNRDAVARYTDADGVPRTFVFPVPEIEVVAPTPTPTATPARAYMPLGLTERCTPAQRRVDVALVLDTSTSMGEPAGGGAPGTKLDAATAAARRFVGALRLQLGDQAAVVTFNNSAALVRSLTSDSAAIDRSLEGLVLNTQTRPHLGLEVALGELDGPRHRAQNARAIVLLTDGRANPDPPSRAVQRAAAAKAQGIVLFTVALGSDVDTEALRTIASEPAFFFTAVDGAALGGIFTRIAGAIPCPADTFWGRR